MKHTIQEEQVERFDKLDIKHFNDGWQEALKSIMSDFQAHAKQNTYEDNEALVYKTTMKEAMSIISNRMGIKI